MNRRAFLRAVAVLAGLGIATLFLLGVVSFPNATTFREHGHLGIFVLLYLEEAGVPTLLPGEAFALYAGHILPPGLLSRVGIWLAMIAAVTLGASTLYGLSRVFGRRLLRHPLGRLVHISPARLAAAERHFRRWGPWGVLIGRHLPGLRIPITITCGLLRMRYGVFAACVALSTAVWAGLLLGVGAMVGEDVAPFLTSAATPVVAGALFIVATGGILLVGWLRQRDRKDSAWL